MLPVAMVLPVICHSYHVLIESKSCVIISLNIQRIKIKQYKETHLHKMRNPWHTWRNVATCPVVASECTKVLKVVTLNTNPTLPSMQIKAFDLLVSFD